MSETERRPRERRRGDEGRWRAGVVAVFVVSRLVYALGLGVRFDARPLHTYYQYVDPSLLKEALVQSLWHLHSQPPGFNLFLGLVLKAAGDSAGLAFQGLYCGLGLVLALALFDLLRGCQVSRQTAGLVTAAVIVHPVTVLYENWLFYACPVAVILLLSACALRRLAAQGPEGSPLHAVVFFTCLLALACTWGVFHLAWLLPPVLGLPWLLPGQRRWLAVLGGLLVAAVLGLYLKNAVLFGGFGVSKIYPSLNLAMMTTGRLPPDEHDALLREGRLSPRSTLPIYGTPLSAYAPYVDFGEATGVPVLDRPTKEAYGLPNWHHRVMPRVADLYRADAWTVFRARPGLYLEAVGENVLRYSAPGHDTFPFNFPGYEGPNGRALRSSLAAHSSLCGQLAPEGPGLTLLVLLPVLWIGGLLIALGRAPPPFAHVDLSTRLVCGYAVYTIAYLFVLTVLVSAGDHNRYRFAANPLYAFLLGLLLERWQLWRRGEGRSPTSSPRHGEAD